MERVGRLNGVVYFEECPRHPNNSRPHGSVAFKAAAKGGTIGVDQAALDAPRHGPLAL